MKYKNLYVLSLVMVFMLGIFSPIAFAHNDENEAEIARLSPEQVQAKKDELKAERDKLRQELSEKVEVRKQEAEKRRAENDLKLDEKKLEICQKHEADINRHMQKIAERTEKHKQVFDKIFERVQDFYASKNLNLDGYSVLIEDAEGKKAIAEEAIARLQAEGVDFGCESDDPVGVAVAFKSVRSDSAEAMQEYKTSLKNLISQIKPVAHQAEDNGDTTEGES